MSQKREKQGLLEVNNWLIASLYLLNIKISRLKSFILLIIIATILVSYFPTPGTIPVPFMLPYLVSQY